MFGYVVANTKKLTPAQQRRYQGYYCGLCRALGKQHGSRGRLTLSYDMTFLAMLLTSLYDYDSLEGNARCVLHPTKLHDWVENPAIDYCADMSVALAYYNFLDNWQDDHNPASLTAAKALKKKEQRVSKKYPMQCAAIHHCISHLNRYEQENCQDLDQVSGAFGELLAAIFEYRHDFWSSSLHEMGLSLGKFIYLMDAYEDLEKDIRHKRYNPLASMATQPDFHEHCLEILNLLMSQCAASFEKLPILQDGDGEILRNIIYSGVWTRYRIISSKRNRGATTHE